MPPCQQFGCELTSRDVSQNAGCSLVSTALSAPLRRAFAGLPRGSFCLLKATLVVPRIGHCSCLYLVPAVSRGASPTWQPCALLRIDLSRSISELALRSSFLSRSVFSCTQIERPFRLPVHRSPLSHDPSYSLTQLIGVPMERKNRSILSYSI